jgi:hypothetical protein
MKLVQALVEKGGGIWIGIQECEGMDYDLVLFNSPKTGSTLALKTSEITPLRVQKHIAVSDAKFATQRNSILSVQEKIS